MKVDVEFGLCESNGVCVGVIPEVFRLGNERLTVLQPVVTPANESLVREAVRRCPRQAVSVKE
ncbi:ferredoxin [Mycobacterium lacus]|uniref:Ferredoxin n=1 Tax=Mycobacterium lacus TaxID=169765 RepID=A0A1X1YVQ3_9MYCO|nr:ferredoxin [Mycobacterium lacus]MCV7124793.1 ferredoxin [Mycobacterium lacus]ORW15124.1 ferredoxin [Mycobacterium lacus]BBX94995.1 ferredoxin [Mycobacterium lacus]